MGNQAQLYSLQPLTSDEMIDLHKNASQVSPDELQLQADCCNVLEKRVPIESFDPAYQQKIKDYYRFYGTRMYSDQPIYFKRTLDTLDLV